MTNVRRADLVLDSERAPDGAGFRGVSASPRMLVFRSGAHQVEVAAPTTRTPPRFLWGQVVGEGGGPCPGATVSWVSRDGADGAPSETDAWGEFRVAAGAVSGGALRVRVAATEFDCVLPGEPPDQVLSP